MVDTLRRATDSGEQHEIEQLIAQEDDPKIRLQLMVMNRINLSLIANTATTDEIAKKLDDHVKNFAKHTIDEEAILNRGRGAWTVAAWVIGVAQLIAVGVWTSARNDIAEMHAAIEENKIVHVQIIGRIEALETKK